MRILALLFIASWVPFSSVTLAADPPKPADAQKAVAENTFDFTGRLEASTVDIRPRVTGELEKVFAKDGALIKKGDPLAQIDSRIYKAKLEAARANLASAVAGCKMSAANLERLKKAAAKGVVSEDDIVLAEAEKDRTDAIKEAAKAEVEIAELNLGYTLLRSPMDGRIGKFSLTPGSLLIAEGPAIVSVVATDPLFVAFDVDEKTLLKLRREGLIEKGKLTAAAGLIDEEGFPHKTVVDFADNQLDTTTGTIRLRGVLPNPKGLFLPGMSVRVRVSPASK